MVTSRELDRTNSASTSHEFVAVAIHPGLLLASDGSGVGSRSLLRASSSRVLLLDAEGAAIGPRKPQDSRSLFRLAP
jgi:hypothetical protein